MQTNRQIVYDHWKPNFCIHKLVDKVFYPRILSEPPLNQGGYDIEDDKNNFMKDAEYILYGGHQKTSLTTSSIVFREIEICNKMYHYISHPSQYLFFFNDKKIISITYLENRKRNIFKTSSFG